MGQGVRSTGAPFSLLVQCRAVGLLLGIGRAVVCECVHAQPAGSDHGLLLDKSPSRYLGSYLSYLFVVG